MTSNQSSGSRRRPTDRLQGRGQHVSGRTRSLPTRPGCPFRSIAQTDVCVARKQPMSTTDLHTNEALRRAINFAIARVNDVSGSAIRRSLDDLVGDARLLATCRFGVDRRRYAAHHQDNPVCRSNQVARHVRCCQATRNRDVTYRSR